MQNHDWGRPIFDGQRVQLTSQAQSFADAWGKMTYAKMRTLALSVSNRHRRERRARNRPSRTLNEQVMPATFTERAFEQLEEGRQAKRLLAKHQLTARERNIVLLRLAHPRIKNREIAQPLGITERTVKSDLRLIRYRASRPDDLKTRRRRKTD